MSNDNQRKSPEEISKKENTESRISEEDEARIREHFLQSNCEITTVYSSIKKLKKTLNLSIKPNILSKFIASLRREQFGAHRVLNIPPNALKTLEGFFNQNPKSSKTQKIELADIVNLPFDSLNAWWCQRAEKIRVQEQLEKWEADNTFGAITKKQLEALENLYKEDPHPISFKKRELAGTLKMKKTLISAWFEHKNVMARMTREEAEEESEDEEEGKTDDGLEDEQDQLDYEYQDEDIPSTSTNHGFPPPPARRQCLPSTSLSMERLDQGSRECSVNEQDNDMMFDDYDPRDAPELQTNWMPASKDSEVQQKSLAEIIREDKSRVFRNWSINKTAKFLYAHCGSETAEEAKKRGINGSHLKIIFENESGVPLLNRYRTIIKTRLDSKISLILKELEDEEEDTEIEGQERMEEDGNIEYDEMEDVQAPATRIPAPRYSSERDMRTGDAYPEDEEEEEQGNYAGHVNQEYYDEDAHEAQEGPLKVPKEEPADEKPAKKRVRSRNNAPLREPKQEVEDPPRFSDPYEDLRLRIRQDLVPVFEKRTNPNEILTERRLDYENWTCAQTLDFLSKDAFYRPYHFEEFEKFQIDGRIFDCIKANDIIVINGLGLLSDQIDHLMMELDDELARIKERLTGVKKPRTEDPESDEEEPEPVVESRQLRKSGNSTVTPARPSKKKPQEPTKRRK